MCGIDEECSEGGLSREGEKEGGRGRVGRKIETHRHLLITVHK